MCVIYLFFLRLNKTPNPITTKILKHAITKGKWINKYWLFGNQVKLKGPVLRDFVIKKNKFCCKADLAWALRSRNSIPVLTKMTWTICITNIALPENSIQKSLDTLIIVLQNKRVHEYWIRQSTSVPPLKHKLCVHCDRKREMRVFEYSIIGTIPHRSLKANKTV